MALYLIYIIPLYFFDYLSSLDSAQHSLTANILNHFLFERTSDVYRFYQITEFPVGYWVTHIIYAGLHYLFTPNIAEKFLLTLYFFLFAHSSWYLTNKLTQRPTWLIVFFIPFANHMYMGMGYYPYGFAFIGLFYVIGYTLSNIRSFNLKKSFILSFLLIILYFTHGIVLSFGLVIVALIFLLYTNKTNFKKNIVYFLIGSLPASLFMLFYVLWIMNLSGSRTAFSETAFQDLVREFFTLRLMTVFHHKMELRAGLMTSIPLFGIGLLHIRYISKANKIQILWFGLFIVLLLIYLIMPNFFLTGSLVNRIGVFSLITFIFFLNTNNAFLKSVKINYLYFVLALVVTIATIDRKLVHNYFANSLSRNVTNVKSLEPYIKDKDLVLGINESGIWIERHMLCYLGDEKLIFYIKNPQLAGQFPIRWSKDAPYYTLGPEYAGRHSYFSTNIARKHYGLTADFEIIDHIVVWGYKNFVDATNSNAHKLEKSIKNYYEIAYVTPNGKAAIYSLKSAEHVKTRLVRMDSDTKTKERIMQKAKENRLPYKLQLIKEAFNLE